MLIVSGIVQHPSFRNIAEDIIEVAHLRNVATVWGPDYLNGKKRNYMLRPIVIGSPIDTNLHFFLSLFYAHPVPRLTYLTAEGPLDTTWWKPNLFSSYRVVANSQWTARWLSEAKIRVDAVVHHAYNPAAVRQALEKPYTPPVQDDGTVWLSYIGQVGPRKRVEYALQALRIAQKKTGYGIGLVTNALIGPFLRPDDRKIIQVGSFGLMPRDRALAIVAGTQYYMHLSRSEGFGMPALEARALGVPLIAVEMQPTTEFIPKKAALWVSVKGLEKIEGLGPMSFVEHVYDVDEAASIMVQAHDIYLNYRDEYEEMRQKCLEDISSYEHTRLYGQLLNMLGL
jgi:glycosyltransferase involved in cell wall biosynthesis